MDDAIDQLQALNRETALISHTVTTADLATPVDHLGRWKVRDVVAHLGGVHRWAARIVRSRSMDGPGSTKSKLDGDELRDWFAEGADELIDTFRNNDRDDACPNFNPGSTKAVSWWLRRQLHETTVHRWDIERALGDTTAIDPAVAADGVDEFLDVFVRTRGKQTLISPLILSTTEPSQSWTLTIAAKPGRLDVTAGRLSDVTDELAGNPEQLLLHVWGRLSVAETDLQITGDKKVALSFRD